MQAHRTSTVNNPIEAAFFWSKCRITGSGQCVQCTTFQDTVPGHCKWYTLQDTVPGHCKWYTVPGHCLEKGAPLFPSQSDSVRVFGCAYACPSLTGSDKWLLTVALEPASHSCREHRPRSMVPTKQLGSLLFWQLAVSLQR